MKTVIGTRQTGKTTKLIERSAETHYYIVVSTHREACRVRDMAMDMGLDIPLPLTYDEFLRGEYHPDGVGGLLIDNVDLLLKRLIVGGANIDTITLNIGDSLTVLRLDTDKLPKPPKTFTA